MRAWHQAGESIARTLGSHFPPITSALNTCRGIRYAVAPATLPCRLAATHGCACLPYTTYIHCMQRSFALSTALACGTNQPCLIAQAFMPLLRMPRPSRRAMAVRRPPWSAETHTCSHPFHSVRHQHIATPAQLPKLLPPTRVCEHLGRPLFSASSADLASQQACFVSHNGTTALQTTVGLVPAPHGSPSLQSCHCSLHLTAEPRPSHHG